MRKSRNNIGGLNKYMMATDAMKLYNQLSNPSVSLKGGKTKRKHRGGSLPFPIAARDLSRHEPLYPAIHARLIGGAKKTRKIHRKKHRGGFSPAIIGPLIDNFHYIAPVIGLAAYKYHDMIKSSKKTNKKRRNRK